MNTQGLLRVVLSGDERNLFVEPQVHGLVLLMCLSQKYQTKEWKRILGQIDRHESKIAIIDAFLSVTHVLKQEDCETLLELIEPIDSRQALSCYKEILSSVSHFPTLAGLLSNIDISNERDSNELSIGKDDAIIIFNAYAR